MSPRELKSHCGIDDASLELLRVSMEELGLSARAYDRILKVARTIADLQGQEHIECGHVAEAIQFRSLDREYWT